MVDNPFAFPGNKWTPDNQDVEEGMTLRDYFAAVALSGNLANSTSTEAMAKAMPKGAAEIWAGCAYALADAMLAERSKK